MAKWEGRSFPQPDPRTVQRGPTQPATTSEARKQQAEKIRNDLRYEIDDSLAKRTGRMEPIKKSC